MSKIIRFIGLFSWALCAHSAEQSMPMNHKMPVSHNMPKGHNMAGMVHDHQPVAVPEGAAVPQLEIRLFRDEMSGFNLHLKLANFNIAPPEFEKTLGRIMEGHAHLYINGKKTQRIYGRYVHLQQEMFKEGINMVMVSLNAHNHDVWTYNDQQILASIAIQRDKEKFQLVDFASSPLKP